MRNFHSKQDAISVVKKIITSHVDGAIIFDDELEEEDIQQITSYYVPTIVINNKVEGDRCGCVVFGYEHNLKNILSQKLENDNEITPVFLHVHDCGRLLARTEKAFVSVCKDMNREYAVLNVDDSSSRTYLDFKEYFKKHNSGYFVAYRDSIAAAIVNAATDSGLKVPEQVEVLSLIGTKYANITRPTLSSFDIDMQDVGRRSMHMLMDLMKNELEKKTYRIESVYTKRGSTKE